MNTTPESNFSFAVLVSIVSAPVTDSGACWASTSSFAQTKCIINAKIIIDIFSLHF